MNQRTNSLLPVLVLASLVAGVSCRNAGRSYSGKGLVVSVAGDRESVVIQHEDIEDFMPAMTMLLAVKERDVLQGIAAGDLVDFRLTVTSKESWISAIRRTGHSDLAPLSESGTVLKPGSELSPFYLTDQDGQTVRSADLQGKALAITFIYTRCPLPDYCPRFTANFSAVQKELAERFEGRFRLLSVSLDPVYDTPRVLKEYGRRHKSDFREWSYLTGPMEEIRALTRQFGVSFWDDKGLITHSAACGVFAPSGKVYKLYRSNTWTPGEIISDITVLLSGSTS